MSAIFSLIPYLTVFSVNDIYFLSRGNTLCSTRKHVETYVSNVTKQSRVLTAAQTVCITFWVWVLGFFCHGNLNAFC